MAAALALSSGDLKSFANDEPRIRDLRVAERLGMARTTNIRRTIEANRVELEGFGPLHSASAMVRIGSGAERASMEYWLNEGQVLVICMLSRTPQAAQVRKEVIEVFMAYRRGLLTGEIAQVANDAPRRGRPPGLSMDLPEKARLVWAYMEPRLSAESWMPIALSDVATGSGVRYSSVSTVVNTLVDRKLLWRRKGPHQKAPNEYRLRFEGSTREAPKVAVQRPATVFMDIPDRHAIVDGLLIDMTPMSYRKGERVAVRLRNGNLGLYTLLEDAPDRHFLFHHCLSWIGRVDDGVRSSEGYRSHENVIVIGRVVGPVLPPPADVG